MICSPDGLMRYNDSGAIVDDMPLLSQWIKKSTCFHKSIFWKGRTNSNLFKNLTYMFEPLQFLVIFCSSEQSDIMPNGIAIFLPMAEVILYSP